MSAKIVLPNEPPKETKIEWLHSEVIRLQLLIEYNARKAAKLQGQTVRTINKLTQKMANHFNQ